MDEHERAELERLLQNSQAGIEKKTIIERLSGKIADGNDDFIQIDKETQLENDGTIREIADMKPLSERSVISTHSVRYALEVNRGTFDRLGLNPGDKIDLPDF